MKQILKDGDPKTRKFSCEYCSCEFIADIRDYKLLLHGNGIRVRCPYCDIHLDVNFKDAPLHTEE
jgi:uncharacterized Zn-finger protein